MKINWVRIRELKTLNRSPNDRRKLTTEYGGTAVMEAEAEFERELCGPERIMLTLAIAEYRDHPTGQFYKYPYTDEPRLSEPLALPPPLMEKLFLQLHRKMGELEPQIHNNLVVNADPEGAE